MNNLNKKPKQKLYLPSFEPKEADLELTAKERSVDRLVRLTLDNVSNEANAVLDFTNMVSEQEKWRELKYLKHEFEVLEETITKVLQTSSKEKSEKQAVKSRIENLLNYTNILEVELNSSEAIKALGRENIYVLNALLDNLKARIDDVIRVVSDNPEKADEVINEFSDYKNKFFEKLFNGFVTEDTSSEPVQVQIFNNLTKAMWIPPYPLADIISLYDEYQDRKPDEDYSQKMKERFENFLEPKIDELNKQIKKEKERALKLKRDFESKVNPEFQELLRRYADYWLSMTPAKLYEYIIKRRAVENFAEDRVNLNQLENLYKVWADMLSEKPMAKQSPEKKSKIARQMAEQFEQYVEELEIPEGEKDVPPYDEYKTE
jgi:hypothetical protein